MRIFSSLMVVFIYYYSEREFLSSRILSYETFRRVRYVVRRLLQPPRIMPREYNGQHVVYRFCVFRLQGEFGSLYTTTCVSLTYDLENQVSF